MKRTVVIGFGHECDACGHDGSAFGFYGMDSGSGPLGTMVMPLGFKMEQTSVTGSEYDGYAFWYGYAVGFLM